MGVCWLDTKPIAGEAALKPLYMPTVVDEAPDTKPIAGEAVLKQLMDRLYYLLSKY